MLTSNIGVLLNYPTKNFPPQNICFHANRLCISPAISPPSLFSCLLKMFDVETAGLAMFAQQSQNVPSLDTMSWLSVSASPHQQITYRRQPKLTMTAMERAIKASVWLVNLFRWFSIY